MAINNPIRFKTLLAWSSNNPPIPAAVLTPINWLISERGISGRFVSGGTSGAMAGLTHRNVNLQTGFIPLSLLQDDSLVNPRLRRFVEVNDPMTANIFSTAGSPGGGSVALTTAPMRGLPDYYEGDAYRDGVRNLCAWGGTVVTNIGIGASFQFSLDLAQGGQSGYLVIGCATNPGLVDMTVTEVTYDNQALIDGQNVPAAMFAADNTDSPLIGAFLETNHQFTITIQNNTGAIMQDVAVAVTAG